MKNLGSMIKQAQEMQTKMAELQDRLSEMECEGQSGAGMVKVVVTGKGEMRKISIDPSLIDPNDVEVLEDLIIAAANDARQKADRFNEEEMKKLTGGLSLPPGMKLPF